MSGSKEDLRSTVPESNNLVSVALKRNRKSAAKAKIGNLQDALGLIEKKILRLEIAMENAMAMTVGNALTELKQEALDKGGGERARIGALAMRIDELLEIGVKILKYKVEERLTTLVVVDVLDAEETNDVEGLREQLEKRNLAKSSGWNAFFVHFEASFLESDELAALLVLRLVHLPVGSFADLFKLLVLVHGG